MKFTKLAKVVSSLSLIASINVQAAAPMPAWVDNAFLTINPKAKLSGPVQDLSSSTIMATYADKVAKIGLIEAHSRAKSLYDEKNYRGYYTVMLLALTVPMHEGLFTHFRATKNTAGKCKAEKQKGNTLKDQKKTKVNFVNAFTKGATPFLLTCDKFAPNSKITQIIAGGGDGSDVGIMQLATLWHYDEFLKPGKYKSVKATFNYGYSHLMRGFIPVMRNYKDYPCLKNKDGSLNYHKLARGVWAGKYNSGNIKVESVCRFANAASPHKNKDIGFNINMENMMKVASGGKFGIKLGKDAAGNPIGFYPKVSSDLRKAILEINNNIKNNTNNRTYLNKVMWGK